MKLQTAPVVLLAVLAFCPRLLAQQTASGGPPGLSNDSVIKLVKAELSDDLIVAVILALPGAYDVSPDVLMTMKAARVSDKVISAMALKRAFPTSAPGVAPDQKSFAPAPISQTANLVPPRVFLQSASKGTNRNAARDQSMEMSKDLEKDCPGVRVTINQQLADYTVLLNHIEVGFVRDNQIQVANKDGDLMSKTKEGGGIAGGLKSACALILADWARSAGRP
jgi:hypothetical protein